MKTYSKLSFAFLALSVVVSLAVSVSTVLPVAAANTTYYVDCAAGNDANNGTSTGTAWATVTRASQNTYGAGDQILLKRGCVWTNQTFTAQGSGTVASRVTLADYGTGNLPKIDAFQNSAVFLQNNQNWTVKNLDLTQHGSTPETLDSNFAPVSGTGAFLRGIIEVYGRGPVGVQACGEPCTARNITIDSVKVHDGQWDGIYVSGGDYDVGLTIYGYTDNVIIQNSEVWNNNKNGIEGSGTYTKNITYPTTNIKSLADYVHDNGGDGIVYGPVEHGTIDGNNCAYNGRLRNARVGCWTWDSHDTVIQFNESHHTQNPNTSTHARDGGGFDLDLGTEDGVMQYNWGHDNVGEGFLLMAWPIGYGYQRGKSHNLHMRYNIGERDGKQLGSGVYIFGGTNPAVIYNNVIYFEPTRVTGSTMVCEEGGAYCVDQWGKSGSPLVYLYNNIFINNGTVTPGATSTLAWLGNGTSNFNNNIWYRVEGGVNFKDGNTYITTWAGWQAKGRDTAGYNANPSFTGAFGTGPAAYHLAAGSIAIDHGTTVTVGLRGMGTRDYFGVAIPRGATYDIGAAEY